MPDNKYPVEMISGVPVMTAPAEIDVTAAEQLRAVLLEWAGHGHATVVVDMTRTRFCDSAGPGVLVRAHKRALEEGGELRLVIPPVGTVFRIFILTSLDCFIPRFGSRQEALLQRPAAPGSGHRVRIRLPGSAALRIGPAARIRECGPVADTRLAAASALSIMGEDAHAGG